MGRFPTGVTVVAAPGAGDEPVGLTVNSLTSVSLDPPLVLVCIDREASCHDRMIEAGSFAVSILGTDQVEVARRFAEEPPDVRRRVRRSVGDRCGGRAPHELGQLPRQRDDVLAAASESDPWSAWVACTLEAVHPGGDHSILLGRVAASGIGRGEALTYYRGEFGTVAK